MAATLTTTNAGRGGTQANMNSADLSGTEIIRAAPTDGRSIYVRSLTISNLAIQTVTIGAGESAGAVTAVLFGPLYMAANSSISIPISKHIKLPADTALVADSSGTTGVTIIADTYVK